MLRVYGCEKHLPEKHIFAMRVGSHSTHLIENEGDLDRAAVHDMGDSQPREPAVAVAVAGAVAAEDSGVWKDDILDGELASPAVKGFGAGNMGSHSICFAADCIENDNGRPAFKTCAGCRGVCYCSRRCQKAHWPSHKKVCKDVRRFKEVMGEQHGLTAAEEAGAGSLTSRRVMMKWYNSNQKRTAMINLFAYAYQHGHLKVQTVERAMGVGKAIFTVEREMKVPGELRVTVTPLSSLETCKAVLSSPLGRKSVDIDAKMYGIRNQIDTLKMLDASKGFLLCIDRTALIIEYIQPDKELRSMADTFYPRFPCKLMGTDDAWLLPRYKFLLRF